MKGLEALKHIYLTATDRTNALCVMDYETIQKELKALEIIKKKNVEVKWLKIAATLEGYNMDKDNSDKLTREEYDLINEVLYGMHDSSK